MILILKKNKIWQWGKLVSICLIISVIVAFPLKCDLKWKLFGNLITPRQYLSAVAISDTEALVIGGYDNNSNVLSTCEIIDIANYTVKPGPSMNYPHAYFVTLVTKDTNIYVISGCTQDSWTLTPAVEMFDKSTRKWKYIGDLKIARWQHNAEFLNDHEILVIGGRHGDATVMDDVEIFDINTGQSKLVNPYPFPTSDGVCGYTSDGKLISTGGRAGGNSSYRSKYIYEYKSSNDTWQIIDSVKTAINMPTLIKLWDKRLLFMGGSYDELPDVFSREIYIENNGKFSYVGDIWFNRIRFSIAQYNKDSVLIIGGYLGNGNYTKFCDWFNVNNYGSIWGPDLLTPMYDLAAVSLPSSYNIKNCTLLAIGGRDNQSKSLSSIEILEPDFNYKPPQITDTASGCSDYFFTVKDSNLIDSVRLNTANSKNVNITVTEQLPAKVVHVKVSLNDRGQDGSFDISCISGKTGLSTGITGIIKGDLSNLSAVFPAGIHVIFVGDTIVNAVKCTDFEIANSGTDDITIDDAEFANKVMFTFPFGQLPVTVRAGEKKILRVCFFSSNIEGVFNDTLYLKNLCDTLFVPVNGTAHFIHGPEATEWSSDCENFYFTVVDSNLIDRMELTGFNQNVKIHTIETLPASVVHVVVSLIDINKFGFFEVTCYSNKTGLSRIFSGKIFGKLNVLKVLAPLDSGAILVGHTESCDMICVNILIKNSDSVDYVLDEASLWRNVEFSIPQGQLPLIIPANGQGELTICYLPSELGLQHDTLYLKDVCDTMGIPVKATGDTSYYSGKSKCNVDLNLQTIKPGKVLSIKTPYPNPGSNFVNVTVNETTPETEKCLLYDFKGESVMETQAYDISIKQSGKEKYFEKEYKINLTNLSSGMYFIVIETSEGKKVYPYYIIR